MGTFQTTLSCPGEAVSLAQFKSLLMTVKVESEKVGLHSQVKMGTEGWVLKGTKLITNTKKQRLRI